jgi:hypothetical protein
MATEVEFWFDPGCPWSWGASRWLVAAAGQRDLAICWRFRSLELLNQGEAVPGHSLESYAEVRREHRALAAAREAGHDEAGRLYTALGTLRYHDRRTGDLVPDAVSSAGLGDDVAAAADDARWDDVVRSDHEEAAERVGSETGTPILAVDGAAWFGPVLRPPPGPDRAGEVWDAVSALMRQPEVHELSRGRGGRAELPDRPQP